MKRLILAAVLVGAALFAHALEPEHSGAWYDPDNSGHGITLHVWDGGAVYWWFSYEQTGSTWLMSNVFTDGIHTLFWPQSHQFPVAHSVVMYEAGTAVLSETPTGLNLKYSVLLGCGVEFSPVPPWCDKFADSQGSIDLIRLTPP